MTKQVQTAWLTDALRELLGIRGRFPASLDEIIIPTVELASLASAPYGRVPVPCGGTFASAAAVGANSYVGLEAGAGAILEVLGIYINNDTGGALTYNVGLVTPAVYAADFTESSTPVVTAMNGELSPDGSIQITQHNGVVGSHVNLNFTLIGAIASPFGGAQLFPLPHAVQLRAGGPRLVVSNDTANSILNATSFFCRSWPLTP